MDRSNVCYLVSKTYTQDSLGQFIPTETKRKVFCDVSSISLNEWVNAGQQGLSPEYRITMFSPDYKGEDEVEYNDTRYSVYRSYIGKNEAIELYLSRKVGINGN